MDTTRIGYGSAPRADTPAATSQRTTAAPKPADTAATPPPPPARDTSAAQADRNAAAARSTRATREDVQKLLDRIASQIKPESRALNFKVNEDINGVVVSVIDTETEKLVRQIPAEYMVRVAEALQEYNTPVSNPGFLLEDKA